MFPNDEESILLPLMQSLYRLNSKVSRIPNFCVGCFELMISKSFAVASKMGQNGKKIILLAIFFCETHFCVGCWTKS